MKTRMFKILLFFGSIIISVSFSEKEKTCVLKGEVIGRDSDAILLFKRSQFPKYKAEIPIKDSTFEYSINFIYPETYELVFKEEFKSGSMKTYLFFTEDGEVHFTLHPREDDSKNVITGGILNAAIKNYQLTLREMFWDEIMLYSDSLTTLYEAGTAMSEAWNILQEKLGKTTGQAARKKILDEQNFLRNTGKAYSPQARRYNAIQDSIMKELKLWEFKYIEENTSLLSYHLFMKDIKRTAKSCCWEPVDASLVRISQQSLNRFSSKFKGHPYKDVISNTLEGLSNIHEGGRFIDFNLPSVYGDNVSLAKTIKSNRFVLLDFWSTWCSPCIKTSKELMPIYEKYKESGFAVLGIAQGNGEYESLLSFIEKENYPWLNLIDRDSKAGIWDKYNILSQGGALFLINSSGKIVAVNPSVDEIQKQLAEFL